MIYKSPSYRFIFFQILPPFLVFLAGLTGLFLFPPSAAGTLLPGTSLLLLMALHLRTLILKRRTLNEYDKVILGRLCPSGIRGEGCSHPPRILQEHMQACQDSRNQTTRIIHENTRQTEGFAVEMKDSVYLITSINGSVQVINDKIESLNADIVNSSSAIEEISQTILEFSRQIENQSSSVVQTSAAVEQMDASINNVREITGKKQKTARNLHDLTGDSQNQMEQMNQLIEQVNTVSIPSRKSSRLSITSPPRQTCSP